MFLRETFEMNPTQGAPFRRKLLLAMGGSVLMAACGRSPQAQERQWQKQFEQQDQARQKAGLPPLTPEQQALRHKFRGVTGGELTVDAFGVKKGVNIFDENGHVFFMASSTSRNNRKQGFGTQFGVPVTLRAEWREEGPEVDGVPQNPFYQDMSRAFGPYIGGIVVATYTTTVAERIPDELLDDLRAKGGGLRLKVRLHDEGVLVGWDIERRPGFDPKKRDSYGEAVYVPPGWVKTGGDFKEARGVYWLEDESGNLVRAPSPESLGGVMPAELARRGIVFNPHGFLREKGWYIHPKTGERIETDF